MDLMEATKATTLMRSLSFDAKSYYEIVLILLIKILLLRPNKYYFRFFLVNLN